MFCPLTSLFHTEKSVQIRDFRKCVTLPCQLAVYQGCAGLQTHNQCARVQILEKGKGTVVSLCGLVQKIFVTVHQVTCKVF
jgi:hypothetical protein